jgi:hypothetical protein
MMAITIALFGFSLLALTAIIKLSLAKPVWYGVIILTTSATVAGVVSLLAPGSRARGEVLGSDYSLSPRRVAEIFSSIFPNTVKDLFEAIVNPGTFATIVISVLISLIFISMGIKMSSRKLMLASLSLFWIALIANITARFSENFVYSAYWHYVPVRVYIFFFALVLGMYISSRLPSLNTPNRLSTFLGGILVSIFLIVGTVISMTVSMSQRNSEWQAGSAPIPGIVSDTENPDGMEIGCWRELASLRTLPVRGGM